MDIMINILFVLLAVVVVGLIGIWFFKLEKEKQIKILQEWLLLAVIQAEKVLGSGTGQIKLRYVYDLFLQRFKFLPQVITFEQFGLFVDEALMTMKVMIQNNKCVDEYVNNINKLM